MMGLVGQELCAHTMPPIKARAANDTIFLLETDFTGESPRNSCRAFYECLRPASAANRTAAVRYFSVNANLMPRPAKAEAKP